MIFVKQSACYIPLNDHVEGFITPADKTCPRRVDRYAHPPYGPESGLLFHSKTLLPLFDLVDEFEDAMRRNKVVHLLANHSPPLSSWDLGFFRHLGMDGAGEQ